MKKAIFDIQNEDDFLRLSLETFHYQYEHVEVYRKFVDFLSIEPSSVNSIQSIPFLPIEMFKNHTILDSSRTTTTYFQSSGTTQMKCSKHWIAAMERYEKSIVESFRTFIGKEEEFTILGLLPNYCENPHSSLIHMVDYLMKHSNNPSSDYYLYNHEELYRTLETSSNKKILLFGVSFALLDFLDFLKEKGYSLPSINRLTIIETGGMKGRKKEITKDELLEYLKLGFKTNAIYSEYSMTELLSQAYSLGDNLYYTPNWMRVSIRSTEDPFSYVEDGKSGAINIIDLANIHSCSFIATQDLGKIVPSATTSLPLLHENAKPLLQKNPFQVLGRIDHSDIRGCSLLVS